MPQEFNERPHQNEKSEAIAYVRQLLEEARTESNHEAIPKLERLIQLIDSKRYGLVWEEHAELVEEEMKTKIPVFVEDEKRKILASPDEDYNFLLEGDNLHSLHLLEKTHRGRIDIIYIDPPYNTGNKDFKYNDDYVDSEDDFKHSKWLSFIEHRLQLAKKILSKKGLIFMSIDDYELAQLRILADEIFGEECFVANIAVETSNGLFGVKAKHINKTIVKSKDYVLVYSMSPSELNLSPLYTQSKNLFDTHFTIYKDSEKEMSLSQFISNNDLFIRRSKQVGLTNSVKNIGILMNYFDDINQLVIENAHNIYRQRDYTLRIPDEFLGEYLSGKKIKIGDIYIFQNSNGSPMYLYPFSRLVKMTDDYSSKLTSSVIVGDFWKGYNDDMGNVGKEGGVKLSNGKKPIRLIKNILKISNKNNATILDFFAGSGTTGHAVAQLNKEDDGNRKYILCTNNENNICEEVTYKRLVNIQKDLPHNLKYFKTQFVEKDDEELEFTLLNNVKTLIELEHAVDLEESDKAIAFSLSAIRELDLTGIKTVYVRQQSHALMEREDLARYDDVELIDVPEYYFSNEMKEAGL